MKKSDSWRGVAGVAIGLAVWSALSVWLVVRNGWQYAYGDAEAHLNIARRIADNLTPGYHEVGTVWLPLPHWMMQPLAQVDSLWRNGLAGAIPAALCFVAAGAFLFAAVRRVFHSNAAAATAVLLLALNPNLLYLQSTAMTEVPFLACLMALLYASVRFGEGQGMAAAAAAGLAALAGTLTRYDGWFVIPFVALYFAIVGGRRRIGGTLLFCCIAVLGPVFWFGHNWFITGDAMAFYSGPYSAKAIQGGAAYHGMNNWREAFLYYRTAAELCAGPVLGLMALAGVVAALAKRAFWPLALLLLPGVFYIWSMHSSGATPIYVPGLPPFGWYNTRYGAAALPLLAVAAAALVAVVPERLRGLAAVAVVAAATVPWLLHPQPENWITWKEAQVNSVGRSQWTAQAADFLAPRYRQGTGIVTSFGDLTGIYRRAGIPLRETLTGDNDVLYLAGLQRPDLLWPEWAVLRETDPMRQSVRRNGHYTLELRIVVEHAPAIEIYRR